MGLIIGTIQNPVTIACCSGEFSVTNAYASIQPEIAYDRADARLRVSVRYNRTKQDKLDGKRGFVPDGVGSMCVFDCQISELEASGGSYLFAVAYAKLKAKLESVYGVGSVIDDVN